MLNLAISGLCATVSVLLLIEQHKSARLARQNRALRFQLQRQQKESAETDAKNREAIAALQMQLFNRGELISALHTKILRQNQILRQKWETAKGAAHESSL